MNIDKIIKTNKHDLAEYQIDIDDSMIMLKKSTLQGVIEDAVKENDLQHNVINWVAVTDRLPEVDRVVICARVNQSMSGKIRIESAWGRVNEKGRFSCTGDLIYVDKWAEELPKPPCL